MRGIERLVTWRGRLVAGAVLATMLAASMCSAQTIDKKTLTIDAAKKILAAAEAACIQQNFPASIAIVDDGGNLLAMERLLDWTPASAMVSIGKARTAAMFRRSTNDFETIIKNGRTAMVALDDFTPLQGGVPIVIGGKVVGAIGVSGSNPPKDEEIANLGIAALAATASK